MGERGARGDGGCVYIVHFVFSDAHKKLDIKGDMWYNIILIGEIICV